MPWPTPQDYNEAIQTPSMSIADPEMAEAEPELNPLGLPKAVTGAFASVYRLKCADRDVAIRCFLHNIPDQRDRYKALSNFLADNSPDYMAKFEYIEQGIQVQDAWFPVLKMEWIEGQSLDQYLQSHVNQRWAIDTLLIEFLKICENMREHGIAHGDLQHGNILVVPDEQQGLRLRLVDYDGMFVPALQSFHANELGHPNYQHPRRKPRHFGPFLDNFSAWVIYASLYCLSQDNSLWTKLSAGDDCLLFRRSDFMSFAVSHVFGLFQRHTSAAVREFGQILLKLVSFPLDQVPALDPNLRSASELGTPVPGPQDEAEMQEWSNDSIKLSNPALPGWTTEGEHSVADKITRTGPWPGVKHYAEAVAEANKNFSDPELAKGIPSVFDAGVGPSGMVFYLRCLTRHIAVKCFFQHVPDRAERFEEISKAIKGEAKKYFVEFEYQPEGLKVGNYWYPILKMEWAYGMSLAQAADYYRTDSNYVASIMANFRNMMNTLSFAQIAHCDLQPSNILLVGDRFKLLDYDGMYVPALAGKESLDQGHMHYQHPERSLQHFGPYVDNYSAWVLDTCLMTLFADHNSWSLLNQRLDYCEEDAEWAFSYLSGHLDKRLRRRARFLEKLARQNIENTPPLNPELEEDLPKASVIDSIKKLFHR